MQKEKFRINQHLLIRLEVHCKKLEQFTPFSNDNAWEWEMTKKGFMIIIICKKCL